MAKQPAAYYRPTNLAEALRLLQQPDTVPLAGGTKLIAKDITDAVVDLQALGLNQTKVEGETLQVGATMTLAELTAVLQDEVERAESQRAEDPSSPASLLLKAIHQAGPNTYRNAATLGGSIASRLADSELLAALLVLDTSLVLHTPEPVTLSLVDYLGAAERPFGLITAITIPWQTGQFASERVARTPVDYPIVSVTAWLPEGGSLKLAATGIAALPVRLVESEQAADDELIIAAAKAQCSHPGDFRGDAAYRADMVAVLTRRVLAAVHI